MDGVYMVINEKMYVMWMECISNGEVFLSCVGAVCISLLQNDEG